MNSSLVEATTPLPSSLSRQQRLRGFLSDPLFPCLGAKSALNKERIRFVEYSCFTDTFISADLCDHLNDFAKEFPEPGNAPVSLIAMFSGDLMGEVAFEGALWRLLQSMHDHDRETFSWDPTVGSNSAHSDFSLSIAGRAFFVVGLHPNASRMSRQAPFPCLVFNFHNQFESLKASGKYQSMQAAIRSRDVLLQGSINPVLARFGDASESRQYSGRAVESNWQCPFHAAEPEHV